MMSNITKADASLPSDYGELLADLKLKVHAARMRATLAANSELVNLYLDIGREINKRQERDGWGSGVIARLAKDLKTEYPDMKGLSPRNLLYMKQVAGAFGTRPISQQLVAKLPWGHSLTLLEKLSSENERVWYGLKAIENGWSRAILQMQIETRLHERQAGTPKISNFAEHLPEPQSDMALSILKDPYIFDFLSVGDDAHEREIERELVSHITEFLLELGAGFAYVGKQVPLTVGDGEFYLDLLFYHLKLHCYVVIELKAGAFKPEYAGKLNFYLSAVDDLMRGEHDNHTIGLILCKGKDRLQAEYSLRDINKPMAIADYNLTKAIPEDLKGALPTIEEIEAELGEYAGDPDEPPLLG
jgi:predicted nuclease of restriction endonuclease-like (RecB) superfamily